MLLYLDMQRREEEGAVWVHCRACLCDLLIRIVMVALCLASSAASLSFLTTAVTHPPHTHAYIYVPIGLGRAGKGKEGWCSVSHAGCAVFYSHLFS